MGCILTILNAKYALVTKDTRDKAGISTRAPGSLLLVVIDPLSIYPLARPPAQEEEAEAESVCSALNLDHVTL